jgi:hypothetical protein
MKSGSKLAAVLLVVVAALYRLVPVVGHLPHMLNFSPLMAIALCGGIYLPRLWAWIVPLAALLISDVVLNLHYGVACFHPLMLGSYGCYVLAIWLGRQLQKTPRLDFILAGAVANSLLFYVVTNSLSWLSSPSYVHSPAGWVQALTVGEPGYPPTWTFFRMSLISDVLYTALFVGCMHWARSRDAISPSARAALQTSHS